jgi:hypothetical protein
MRTGEVVVNGEMVKIWKEAVSAVPFLFLSLNSHLQYEMFDG